MKWGQIMLNLLIVEDEQVIRNGLEKHVPWKELGIDRVKAAENAESSLRICESYVPDIIVSDINMPGMNGVELCKCLREKFAQCQIIFISGYSDKEYLKAAISLGAVSYVEKPIDIKELSAAVQVAAERALQNSRKRENVLHELLQPVPGEKMETQVSGMEKKLQGDVIFQIFLLKRKEIIRNVEELSQICRQTVEEISKDCGKSKHLMIDYVEENCFALLLSTDCTDLLGEEEQARQFCEALLEKRSPQDRWFVAAGQPVESLQKVICSYHSAQSAMKVLSYKGWNSYAMPDECTKEFLESLPLEDEYAFRKALTDAKIEEAIHMLDIWYNRLIEKKAEISFQTKNIFYTLDTIIIQVEDMTPGKQRECVDEGRHFLDKAQTIFEMKEYVETHLQRFSQEHEEVKTNAVIKKVMDSMNAHLSDKDMSIKLLADEVYLTPTYLSSLFKKTTGSTIGQYLTEIRMNRAQELLTDPGWKLYQVAEMVGFEDANYFAKTFKKKTGMLPSEYRESNIH